MNDDPSITIGPLKIWVWGRQFPDSTDYWDGNWTNATACCEGAGSRVEVTGAFLHLGELERWRNDLERFYPLLEGSIMLPTIEPTLSVRIEGKTTKTGHLKCTVDITGDHMAEKHQFFRELDQSYLPGLITQLNSILRDYPIRNKTQG